VVLTLGKDGAARLWERKSGRRLCDVQLAGRVEAVAVRSDGRAFLTGDQTGRVQLWEVATGKPLGAPLETGNSVFRLTFSPDERTVLVIGLPTHVQRWDLATGQVVGTYRHPEKAGVGIFSPSGRTVLTGSYAGACACQLWDAATAAPIGAPLTRDSGSGCFAASFSQDGRQILTASDWGAHLWDTATRKPLGAALHPPGMVRTAVLDPSGRTVATAGVGGVQLWELAAPVTASEERLRLEMEVLTGMECDDLDVVRPLTQDAMRERRKRLE
jgi:WD40 repeat protein